MDMENLSSNRSVSRTVTNFRFCSDDAEVPEGGKMVQKRTIQKKLFMDGFYILDDERVRQFLIVGKEEALLIDTGFEDSHVYQAVRSITDLPVQVLMTHGDRDHAGGLKDFGACRIHRGDWNLIPEGIQLEPLKEGDTFRCGDYTTGSDRNSRPYLRQCRVCGLGKEAAAAGRFRPERRADLYVRRTQKSGSVSGKPEKASGDHGQDRDCAALSPRLSDYAGLYREKSSGRRGAEKRTSARRETSVYAVPHLSWNMDGFLLYGETITGSVSCIVAKRKILKGD